jgi:glycosyltransferase involved in cell wall biosynthesis
MKILLVLDLYYPTVNGATVAPDRIAKALAAHGHKVGIIAPSVSKLAETDNTQNPTIYYIPSQPVPLIRVAQNMRISPLPFTDVKHVLDSFMPDVIHIHHALLIAQAAQRYAKDLHIPVVGTNHFMPENLIHNLGPIKNFDTLTSQMKEIMWKYVVNFYEQCAYVTSPTQTAINMLREHGLTVESEAVSNGIDVSQFKRLKRDKNIARKYKIPLDKPVVLYLGRVDGEKRIEDMLNAAKLVLQKTQATFVVAGKGHYLSRLQRHTQRLGIEKNVVFTGFVPDEVLPDMFALADIFVMPSPVELQSVATMEAMASGLPVVAVHAGALFELVQQGKNGFLYEQGNTLELSYYISLLLEDEVLRKKAAEHSKKIIDAHDMRHVVAKLEEIYKKVLV